MRNVITVQVASMTVLNHTSRWRTLLYTDTLYRYYPFVEIDVLVLSFERKMIHIFIYFRTIAASMLPTLFSLFKRDNKVEPDCGFKL